MITSQYESPRRKFFNGDNSFPPKLTPSDPQSKLRELQLLTGKENITAFPESKKYEIISITRLDGSVVTKDDLESIDNSDKLIVKFNSHHSGVLEDKTSVRVIKRFFKFAEEKPLNMSLLNYLLVNFSLLVIEDIITHIRSYFKFTFNLSEFRTEECWNSFFKSATFQDAIPYFKEKKLAEETLVPMYHEDQLVTPIIK